jgi:hypothetical protein
MDDDKAVLGDDPLIDGMNISLRFRRDFVVTDAARLLEAARQAYRELHPEASPQDAVVMVTSAADAIFTILERDGLLGEAIEARLAERERDGLQLGGTRAQVVLDDPAPLPRGWDCFRTGDVFALPPGRDTD